MMIADHIRTFVRENCAERIVSDVRIGLGYTGALLDDGGMGVAYTFREDASRGCSVFVGARPLAGQSSATVLDYFGSRHSVESSVALAVVNALVNRPRSELEQGDVLDLVKVTKGDRVAMIGFFGPLFQTLKARAAELAVFERRHDPSEGWFSADKAHEALPGYDVALITSTALLNGTMDALLEAAQACREVLLLGASTPLVPEVFRPLGVTMLSGIIIREPQTILQIISEGGGMQFFGKYIQKVNVRL
jgi:uncharacterized protein